MCVKKSPKEKTENPAAAPLRTEPLPNDVLPAEAAPERRKRQGRGAGDRRRHPARARDGEARQEVRHAGAQVLQQGRGLHRRLGRRRRRRHAGGQRAPWRRQQAVEMQEHSVNAALRNDD